MSFTISFSPLVKGFPSRYSYQPDFLLGSNNYFYSFKGGNLYRHNVNERRNSFYGVDYPSTIKFVFNDQILENKLYKTIGLQGSHKWEVVNVETDIQDGGYIEEAWFERKEQVFFAFIRTPNNIPELPSAYALRSLSGIGRSQNVTGVPTATNIIFQITPTPVSIGSIVSIGDYLYYALPPYETPVYCGVITNIIQDYVNSDNRIVVNTTGGNVPPITDAYFLSIKNEVAESYGSLGHFAIVDLENNDTVKVELFGVQTEIMKSFP